jgi:uncharacterized protein YcbX
MGRSLIVTDGRAGSVAELWRFPVKSMSGEPLQETELTAQGILGDRALAMIDVETGKVASAKSVRVFPKLLDCSAMFIEPPQLGRDLPPVRITLPNSQTVTSDSPDVDRTLSEYFRRDVRLARSAPDDFTIDQYHPDIEGGDPDHRDTVVEQKLGSAYFNAAGMTSPVPVGAFFDLFPVSVLTTSTLARLAELRPQSRFESRRFRMNVIVDADAPGFPENDWVGREVVVGDTVRVRVAKQDLRCVMTTLAQGDLPNDPEILRAMVRHNGVQVASGRMYPCAGVYAVVGTPGTLRTGDRVIVV